MPAPQVKDWLISASNRLTEAYISTARLDAEIILAHAIGKNRTYLHAHPEQRLTADQLTDADRQLKLRAKRMPIAYIAGYKEFYGRRFVVTRDTLIPRPESEAVIESLKKVLTPISPFSTPNPRLVDIGTGSGCIGITVKLEFDYLNVTLTDISAAALKIAAKNAESLSADVTIVQSDILKELPGKTDIILANLPYVDPVWERSADTHYEPDLALFASDHGTSLIKKLFAQAPRALSTGGFIIIESDPEQHEELAAYAQQYSFERIHKLDYAQTFRLLN